VATRDLYRIRAPAGSVHLRIVAFVVGVVPPLAAATTSTRTATSSALIVSLPLGSC
jgi:hypothetical protein